MKTLALLFALTLSCLAQPLSPNDPAFLQSTSPLRRGLVGYWRLEESSGTRYDCSSYGNHLGSSNNVGSTTAGKSYNAATFTMASSQSLCVSNAPSLSVGNTQAFTITAWIKMTNTTVYQDIIVKEAPEYVLEYNDVMGRLRFALRDRDDASWGIADSTTFGSVSANVWMFVACGFDGSNVFIAINNGTKDTALLAMGGRTTTSFFSLGATSAGISPFGGFMDEVSFHRRYLSDSELTQLYNAGRGTHFPWAHP